MPKDAESDGNVEPPLVVRGSAVPFKYAPPLYK